MLNLSKINLMGVINLAPHSATKVGRISEPQQVLEYAEKIIAEGADIIDIGAEPTNPASNPCTSLEEEMSRIVPVLKLLRQQLSIPISVDTSKPEVMQAAIELGANIINDVRALQRPGAIETLVNQNTYICLMHMSFPEGKPAAVKSETFFPDVVTVVSQFLQKRIEACVNAGIERSRLIIDPGLGYGNFGKNTKDNLILTKQLSTFLELDLPILFCASRKTFIGDILKKPIEDRLFGSLAAATIAAYNGAKIIRTHDVAATKDALSIAMEIKNAE